MLQSIASLKAIRTAICTLVSIQPADCSRQHTHLCRDAEEADIQKEIREQAKGPAARAHELDELTQIYEDRGVSRHLARQVAEELTAKDVIRAHARDELGVCFAYCTLQMAQLGGVTNAP